MALSVGVRAASSLQLLLIGTLSVLSANSAEHWKPVRGSALRSLFSGKEFGDGVHFAYRFRSAGTFTGTEMSRSVAGRWRTTDQELCWQWTRPPGAEECYAVEVDRNDVRLMKDGAETWYGRLTK